MQSLRDLYKAGPGPSSSHTMGPAKISSLFMKEYPGAAVYEAELWGSLAATGKGHLTDYIIEKTFNEAGKKVKVIFNEQYTHPKHPNAMKMSAFDAGGTLVAAKIYFSIGGGDVEEEGVGQDSKQDVYPFANFSDIVEWCKAKNKSLWDVVVTFEGDDIKGYLADIWQTMTAAVESGLKKDGVLPGGLKYPRRARQFYEQSHGRQGETADLGRLFAYTLAVSEENSSGTRVVTAPTCGAAGVIPGVLYYLKEKDNLDSEQIIEALGVAGLIGIVVKNNASVSGAEAGCQAEIGVACSMAAAAAAYLLKGNLMQIEYAAEIGLEHHLGLTCDPVCGLVQVPCIERNAMAARRALDGAQYALFTTGSDHQVRFDTIVQTMLETGHDLKSAYRETSKGGLAKYYYMQGS